MKKKVSSTLISCFLWGGGQFIICKQRMKGLLLFCFQFIMISLELFTGYWPEYFAGLIPKFSFRLHGGFFTKGIWGILTLGVKEGAKNGDYSTKLLIQGIIVILVGIIFLGIYIWNIKDAYMTGKQMDDTGSCLTSKAAFKRIGSKSFPYLILIPVGILIMFITLMPILFSILTAFTNYNRSHLPPGNLVDWVGFDNFKKLFQVPIWSSTFFSVLRWNIIWAIIATFSTYFFGMFQALMLNSKHVKFKSAYRSIMILPWAIPQLISLLVFKNLLNGQFGPLNQFLMDLGLITERIPFLTDPLIAKITILVINLWLGFPMYMIMIQGVLANIDTGLYEAARIDGAGGYKVFRCITLPLVLRATAPLLVMNLAGNFNSFGLIYFLTDGGPVNVNYQFAGDTDILISWIYKLTLNQQMYDMAAVMNIFLFLMVGVVSFFNFRRTKAFKEI